MVDNESIEDITSSNLSDDNFSNSMIFNQNISRRV